MDEPAAVNEPTGAVNEPTGAVNEPTDRPDAPYRLLARRRFRTEPGPAQGPAVSAPAR